MRSIKLILLIMIVFSNAAYSQNKDTLYIKLANDVIEKVLVEKVDSLSVNNTRDSLYIYQKQTIFGDEVQIINKKSLSMVDSIYFYHSLAADAEEAVFQSYTLNGKEEAIAFNPGMDSVLDLTITGADITRTDLNALAFYVDKVKGVFTLDGTGISGWPVTLFADVQFDSSFVIKNNLFFDNVNAFQFAITGIINGDLILENNPWMDYGWGSEMEEGQRTAGFMQVTGVEGDLIVKDLRNFGSNFSGLEDVEYVGGD